MRPSPSPEGDDTGAAAARGGDRGPSGPESDERRRPMPLLLSAIGIAALVGLLYFTMDAFHRWDLQQACVTAGRRDCGR